MGGSVRPIQVLLIEDQPMISVALRQQLNSCSSLRVVSEAAPQDALALAERQQPDIILLDLLLPEGRILDCIPDLLAIAPGARAVVLTGLPDLALHRRALTQGALGLVHKEQPTEVLLHAIQQVHAGAVWIDCSLLASVLSELSPPEKNEETEAETAMIASLTPREREIVLLIGEGLKNKAIADRLCLSERTVHHHLTSIFHKLGTADRLELMIFAQHHGLLKPRS